MILALEMTSKVKEVILFALLASEKEGGVTKVNVIMEGAICSDKENK